MVNALIYASHSLLDPPGNAGQLEDIRSVSLARNSTIELTGFLIATPMLFTQYLEGEQAALDAVMASIRADPRHCDLREVALPAIEHRRCPAWRMTTFEPGSFVSRHLEPAIERFHADPTQRNLTHILRFMENWGPFGFWMDRSVGDARPL